jgi:uncharacterized membrane protein
VSAMQWLGRVDATRTVIYADQYATTRLLPYAGVQSAQINQEMMPPFASASYVFSTYSNNVSGLAFMLIDNQEVSLDYPASYLELTKDCIYSNGSSAVYR